MKGTAFDPRTIFRPNVTLSGANGSLTVFEELAMPLFDSLYNFAQWLTLNREETEDLVQETYAKALKGFGSFQPGTNFRAWIFRILRNTFLTSRTVLAATKTVPLESEEDGEQAVAVSHDTPESILLKQADQKRIRTALEQVPVLFREVLLLCEVEEMSYQEIADTLAVPVGTVMSRLYRGRKALRTALTEKTREAPGLPSRITSQPNKSLRMRCTNKSRVESVIGTSPSSNRASGQDNMVCILH
jgi:RNA polymerase sigma-70 factor (ECF subfamily)